jgi:hypothetical protein
MAMLDHPKALGYTIHTNDIVNYEGRHWTAAQFASELK